MAEEVISIRVANTTSLVEIIKDMECGEQIDTGYVSRFNISRVNQMLRQITHAKKHGLKGLEFTCYSSNGIVCIRRIK